MSANFFESLESRQLMSVSFNSFSGTLTITGTSGTTVPNRIGGGFSTIGGADNLRVEMNDAQTLRISDNGSVSFRELSTVRRIVMDGQGANDTLFVGADVNLPATLTGGAGNDSLTSGAGADQLNGGDGNDQMNGTAGNDTMDGGRGADDFTGGAGTDLATYATRTAAVFVTLDNQPFDGELNEGDRVRTDVENVTGGAGSDRLLGSSAANVLTGNAGDDTIFGRVGSDQLFGGAGNDVLIGATGADQVHGEAGNDIISGGSSNDVLTGGAGNDVITAGSGRDIVNGDAGNDVIFAAEDPVNGPAAPALNDIINGGSGLDVIELDAQDQQTAGDVLEIL